MVSNIIIICIIIAFIAIGTYRGLAKTLFNLIGIIAALAVSRYLAPMAAQLIYNSFFRQGIIDNLEKSINRYGVDYTVQNSLDSVPGWISSIIKFIGSVFGADADSIQRSISESGNFSSNAAKTIESEIGQFIVLLFALVLSLILFIILFIIIKKIIKHALVIFKLPVIKQINCFLGGLLGAVEALIIIFLACSLFYIIMTKANPELLNSELVSGALFKWFCLFD
ncbi:MAG: CvpA family protein [Ruminococcus sp.]|nr:CvpA family protein [Ruminococcus sp.]